MAKSFRTLLLSFLLVTSANADKIRDAAVSIDGEPNHEQGQRRHLRTIAQDEERHLAQCDGGSGTQMSTYMGCFKNRKNVRAFPMEVFGSKSKGHSSFDCESKCESEGYTFFAREFTGQCFCGTAEDEHDMHGLASGCDCCGDDVGSNRMCVWMIGQAAPKCGGTSGTDYSNYVGCYKNKNNNRAFSEEIFGEKSRGHSTKECERECKSEGYSYFAREHLGQCFCSDNADGDHDQHGTADDCDCCGVNVGAHNMCVWKIGQ